MGGLRKGMDLDYMASVIISLIIQVLDEAAGTREDCGTIANGSWKETGIKLIRRHRACKVRALLHDSGF